MWRWIIIALVVVAIGFVAFALARTAQPVDVSVVERGEVSHFIAEQARTRVPRTYRVAMPIAGRIQPIDLVADEDRRRHGRGPRRAAPCEHRGEQ